MIPIRLDFDLLCSEIGAAYRVYIQEELMTERNYRWDNTKELVREYLSLEFDEPGTYSVWVESVNSKNSDFTINNVMLNGEPYQLIGGKEFKVEN